MIITDFTRYGYRPVLQNGGKALVCYETRAYTTTRLRQMHLLDWSIFFALVPILLYVDLKLFNNDDHVIGFRESLILSLWYIIAGLAFGLIILWLEGSEDAVLYYTTYVIEKSLSLDNLFVMSVIFSSLSIPRRYQHRVLVWGIIGVLILRGFMIWAGAALVHQFHWVLFIFAAILIYTGIRMLFMDNKDEVGTWTKSRWLSSSRNASRSLPPFTAMISSSPAQRWMRPSVPSILKTYVSYSRPCFWP